MKELQSQPEILYNKLFTHSIYAVFDSGLLVDTCTPCSLCYGENSCIKVMQATILDSTVEIKQQLHHALCVFVSPPWL